MKSASRRPIPTSSSRASRPDSSSKDTAKLQAGVGDAAAQAWEAGWGPSCRATLLPAPRDENLGTLLCVHDAETEIDLARLRQATPMPMPGFSCTRS